DSLRRLGEEAEAPGAGQVKFAGLALTKVKPVEGAQDESQEYGAKEPGAQKQKERIVEPGAHKRQSQGRGVGGKEDSPAALQGQTRFPMAGDLLVRLLDRLLGRVDIETAGLAHLGFGGKR